VVGEKDAPEAVAQGVVDFSMLPEDGSEILVEIPLVRPGTAKPAGTITLAVRG
jgi:hypothetical protein